MTRQHIDGSPCCDSECTVPSCPGPENARKLADYDRLMQERDLLFALARHKTGCDSERNFERECNCGLFQIRERERRAAE